MVENTACILHAIYYTTIKSEWRRGSEVTRGLKYRGCHLIIIQKNIPCSKLNQQDIFKTKLLTESIN